MSSLRKLAGEGGMSIGVIFVLIILAIIGIMVFCVIWSLVYYKL